MRSAHHSTAQHSTAPLGARMRHPPCTLVAISAARVSGCLHSPAAHALRLDLHLLQALGAHGGDLPKQRVPCELPSQCVAQPVRCPASALLTQHTPAEQQSPPHTAAERTSVRQCGERVQQRADTKTNRPITPQIRKPTKYAVCGGRGQRAAMLALTVLTAGVRWVQWVRRGMGGG